MEKPIEILSTKSISEDLIKQANASNILIDTINFIETKYLEDSSLAEKIKQYSTEKIVVIFTSVNAVEAVFSRLGTKPEWKIFCTSGATKDTLLNHVNENMIVDCAHNASALADEIVENKEIHSCVFFCGNQRLNTLPDKLLKHSIDLEEIIVYETISSPQKIEKNYTGILFYSPSAVESFFSKNNIDDEATLFSIGKTTTKAIRKFAKNNIITAKFPSAESMLKEVREFISTKKQ